MIPTGGIEVFKKYIFNKTNKADIDSWHFKLHYRVTFLLFTAAAILTSAKQYFSKSIICTQTGKVSADLIDTYCWINSTFSVIEDNGPVAFYGVSSSRGRSAEHYVHSYYYWLPYFFFLQAISFYLPHFVWKLAEGGRLNILTQDIRGFKFGDGVKGHIKDMGRYIIKERSYLMNNRMVVLYLVCEYLNFFNMLFQCQMLNYFLNIDLIQYDFNFLDFFRSGSPKMVLLSRIFPTMGKCLYKDYGPSGDIQTLDALCLLPINIFNEKIFLVLWLYLNILTIATMVGLCYITLRIIGMKMFPNLYHNWMKNFGSRNKWEIVLINDLTVRTGLSDFFLFYLLEKNLSHKNAMKLFKQFRCVLEDEKPVDLDCKLDSLSVSKESYSV